MLKCNWYKKGGNESERSIRRERRQGRRVETNRKQAASRCEGVGIELQQFISNCVLFSVGPAVTREHIHACGLIAGHFE